jgi:hypothetical protein
MKSIFQAWERFFFTPTSAYTLAVFRTLFGAIVFISVLGVFPYRATFYGPDAIVSPEVGARAYSAYWPILSFNFIPASEFGMSAFFIILMTAALMLSAGLLTRLASILVFLGLFSLNNRNPYNVNAGDLLLRIDSLILLFASSGTAFSIDRWLDAKRGKSTSLFVTSWPLRLLQLQLTYVYLSTVFLKLSGSTWLDGTALYYALRYVELKRFSFKFLFYYLWQIKLMTWGVLVGEFLMGTLVWVRKVRYPILLVAFLLHMGINLTMQFPVFQYVMLINLVLFVDPNDMKRCLSTLLKRYRSSPSLRGGTIGLKV